MPPPVPPEYLSICYSLTSWNHAQAPLHFVSVHCAPVLHVKSKETDQEMFNEQVAKKARGEDTEKTLMQCIRIACQRQMCQQSLDDETNSVLGASLSVIK